MWELLFGQIVFLSNGGSGRISEENRFFNNAFPLESKLNKICGNQDRWHYLFLGTSLRHTKYIALLKKYI